MNKKHLVRLDASSYASFTQCPYLFSLVNLAGYIPKIDSKYLVFGQAFHTARAILRRDQDSLSKALETASAQYARSLCTKLPPRSMADLNAAIKEWHAQYCTGADNLVPYRAPDGTAAVELPFAREFHSTSEVDVLATGVIDEIGILLDSYDNRLVICDCKTTSSSQSRQDYLRSFQFSTQMAWYAWNARKEFELDYYPAIIIDAVFLRKDSTPVCMRNNVPMQLDAWFIDAVLDSFLRIASAIATKLASDIPFEQQYSMCDAGYEMCPFKNTCSVAPGVVRDMLLKTFFNTRVYDPKTFGSQ